MVKIVSLCSLLSLICAFCIVSTKIPAANGQQSTPGKITPFSSLPVQDAYRLKLISRPELEFYSAYLKSFLFIKNGLAIGIGDALNFNLISKADYDYYLQENVGLISINRLKQMPTVMAWRLGKIGRDDFEKYQISNVRSITILKSNRHGIPLDECLRLHLITMDEYSKLKKQKITYILDDILEQKLFPLDLALKLGILSDKLYKFYKSQNIYAINYLEVPHSLLSMSISEAYYFGYISPQQFQTLLNKGVKGTSIEIPVELNNFIEIKMSLTETLEKHYLNLNEINRFFKKADTVRVLFLYHASSKKILPILTAYKRQIISKYKYLEYVHFGIEHILVFGGSNEFATVSNYNEVEPTVAIVTSTPMQSVLIDGANEFTTGSGGNKIRPTVTTPMPSVLIDGSNEFSTGSGSNKVRPTVTTPLQSVLIDGSNEFTTKSGDNKVRRTDTTLMPSVLIDGSKEFTTESSDNEVRPTVTMPIQSPVINENINIDPLLLEYTETSTVNDFLITENDQSNLKNLNISKKETTESSVFKIPQSTPENPISPTSMKSDILEDLEKTTQNPTEISTSGTFESTTTEIPTPSNLLFDETSTEDTDFLTLLSKENITKTKSGMFLYEVTKNFTIDDALQLNFIAFEDYISFLSKDVHMISIEFNISSEEMPNHESSTDRKVNSLNHLLGIHLIPYQKYTELEMKRIYNVFIHLNIKPIFKTRSEMLSIEDAFNKHYLTLEQYMNFKKRHIFDITIEMQVRLNKSETFISKPIYVNNAVRLNYLTRTEGKNLLQIGVRSIFLIYFVPKQTRLVRLRTALRNNWINKDEFAQYKQWLPILYVNDYISRTLPNDTDHFSYKQISVDRALEDGYLTIREYNEFIRVGAKLLYHIISVIAPKLTKLEVTVEQAFELGFISESVYKTYKKTGVEKLLLKDERKD